MAYVAEVAARFGTTLLDVTHVRDCYRVGTAPDVDLAVEVAGLRSFPVVGADLVVRVPAGVAATCDGELVTGEQRLGECAIVMRLGRVVLTISRIEAAALGLPRPELDRRPAAYHAASLVAHLLVWAIAIVFALPEHRKLAPIIVARPRVAHIAAQIPPPPRVPPLPPKQPAQSKRASDSQIAPREQIEAARAYGDLRSAPNPPPIDARTPMAGFAQGAARLAAKLAEIDVTKRLAEVGPLYDPDADHADDFGHARSFDPTARPEFGTIATGRFATTDRGAAAGENYSIEAEHERPHVRLCDGACVAIGALERDAITDRIGYKKRQLAICYRAGIPDELRFELDISASGAVSDTRVPGPIGGCIAKVIASVTFPAAASDTRVAYSLTFEPPYGPPGTHVPGAARRAPRVQRGGTE